MTRSMPPRLSRRAVVAGSLAAVGASSFGGIAKAAGKRIVVAMPNSPQIATLEPVREYTNVMFRMAYNVFDNLLAVDFRGKGELIPALATKWERTSPLAVDFTLREGVKFHDGRTMTAEDVAFSFGPERMSDPKAPGFTQTRPFLSTIDKVEATGPMTVRVTTKSPDPLLLRRLAGWGGQIISKAAFLAAPNFAAWEKAPVGTGPYKLKDFRYDEKFVFTAHEDYFGGRPKYDELEFRIVPELANRINMLATGEADFATEVPPDQIKVIEATAGAEVAGGPVQNIRVILYDKTNPVLADARVRRALSLAIDRKAITDSLYLGRTGVPNGHQDTSYGELYFADYKAPGFDPEKAKALLKEAGYAGQPIPYKLLNNYYTLQNQTAQILQSMWRNVGLNVVIETKENWSQVLAADGRGIFDASDTIFWQDPVGALVRRYGPTSGVQTGTKSWTNAEFNALCATLQSSLDTAERAVALRKMLTIYDETDPPGTVLHQLTMFYGKRKDVPWKSYPVEYMDFRAANTA
jgi:peptide/nickel transport system substrate-binding protein